MAQTEIKPIPGIPEDKRTPQQICEANGGHWDDVTQTCVSLQEKKKEEAPPLEPATTDRKVIFNEDKTVTLSGADGKLVTLSPQEYKDYLNISGGRGGKLTEGVLEAQAQPNREQVAMQQQAAANEQLARQVGQTQESVAGAAFKPDQGEATRQAIAGAIPRAIGLAVAGLGAGLVKGGAAGSIIPGAGTLTGAAVGGALGAAAGLTSGITQGIISNRNEQRTDNKAAQLKTLTEGKTALSGWTSLARSNPEEKAKYAAEFNNDLQRIRDAYNQLLTDTNADVNKFETAVPELAEFNAFFEFDQQRLISDMQMALQTPSSPDYEMLLLTERYT